MKKSLKLGNKKMETEKISINVNNYFYASIFIFYNFLNFNYFK